MGASRMVLSVGGSFGVLMVLVDGKEQLFWAINKAENRKEKKFLVHKALELIVKFVDCHCFTEKRVKN
jgi:hypothetical protein